MRLAALTGWLMTAGGTRAARARRVVLRVLPRTLLAAGTPPLRRGPWVRRPRVGPARGVGRVVPDVELRRGRRLDDVLGSGWALLVCSTEVPSLSPLPGGARPRVLHRGRCRTWARRCGTGGCWCARTGWSPPSARGSDGDQET